MKNSERLEVCFSLALDGGFGVELGLRLELQQISGLIQNSGVIV